MSYQKQQRELRELQLRFDPRRPDGGPAWTVRPHAYVVTGKADDECEGPHYKMDEWTGAAIYDRVYRGTEEPSCHWRFNVIGRDAAAIVTPIYEPYVRQDGTTAASRDMHRHYCGKSNWTYTFHYLLSVDIPASNRTVRGYLESSDFAYTFFDDRTLAQAVLDSLWAATQGDVRAFEGASHCAFCVEPLPDQLSRSRGYGPDCAKQYGLQLRGIDGDQS